MSGHRRTGPIVAEVQGFHIQEVCTYGHIYLDPLFSPLILFDGHVIYLVLCLLHHKGSTMSMVYTRYIAIRPAFPPIDRPALMGKVYTWYILPQKGEICIYGIYQIYITIRPTFPPVDPALMGKVYTWYITAPEVSNMSWSL